MCKWGQALILCFPSPGRGCRFTIDKGRATEPQSCRGESLRGQRSEIRTSEPQSLRTAEPQSLRGQSYIRGDVRGDVARNVRFLIRALRHLTMRDAESVMGDACISSQSSGVSSQTSVVRGQRSVISDQYGAWDETTCLSAASALAGIATPGALATCRRAADWAVVRRRNGEGKKRNPSPGTLPPSHLQGRDRPNATSPRNGGPLHQ